MDTGAVYQRVLDLMKKHLSPPEVEGEAAFNDDSLFASQVRAATGDVMILITDLGRSK